MDAAQEPRRVPRQRPGREGGRRDENRRRRVAALCDAGLKLFLERSLEAVTIDDITREASVAKGSFYRYFANKRDLVATILEPVATGVERAFGACEAALRDAVDRAGLERAYAALGHELAPLVLSAPGVVALYLQESRGRAVGARAPVRLLADRIAARSIELTSVAARRGQLRAFDPRVSALAVIGAVERLLVAVLHGEDIGDPLLVHDALVSLVLDGLRPSTPTR